MSVLPQEMFPGWRVVLAAGLGISLNSNPIVVSTFGVFFEPLHEEFVWTHSELSLAPSLYLIANGLTLLVIGRLIDRFGARKVILPSIGIFGMSFISLSLLSGSIWELYGIFTALGIIGAGTGFIGYAKVISNWFDKKRGIALALATSGSGIGMVVMPPLAQGLIGTEGWHCAVVVLGLLPIIVALPVVGLLLKESPRPLGLTPDGVLGVTAKNDTPQREQQGLSGSEVRFKLSFWLIIVVFFVVSLALTGCFIQLVPVLADSGLSQQSAAFAMSVAATAIFVGRLGCGYLLDRVFAPYVAGVLFGLGALGLGVLCAGVGGGAAFTAAALLGLALGAEGDLLPYMIARYFGLRAFGEVYSFALFAAFVGSAVGPFLLGASFDASGSYQFVLGGFFVATVVGAGLICRLGPYPCWR